MSEGNEAPEGGGQAPSFDWSQPPVPQVPQRAESGIDRVIPVKNPPALIAYYLAVFSLIPCVGLLLGPAAVILGFLGLNQISRNPGLPGKAHAWVGIVLGGLMTLLYGGLLVFGLVAGAMEGSR